MAVEDLPITERFSAGAIWILDSLRQPGEMQTGALLHEHLQPIALARTPSFPCHRRRILTAADLFAALLEVQSKIAGGVFVHIEAHGDIAEGLTLQSAEIVSWRVLADKLRPVCRASRMQLVITVAACFGAHLLSQMAIPNEPAPFLLLFGPNREITADAVHRANVAFYSELLNSRMLAQAWRKMNEAAGGDRAYAVIPADEMFRRVVREYVSTYCTEEAIERGLAALAVKARASGISRQVVRARQDINRRQLADYVTPMNDFRRRYFYLDEYPELEPRFTKVEDVELPALSG